MTQRTWRNESHISLELIVWMRTSDVSQIKFSQELVLESSNFWNEGGSIILEF